MPDGSLSPGEAIGHVHGELLDVIQATDDLCTGTHADLALRLDLMLRSKQMLTDLIAAIELTLIEGMEADTEDAGRFTIVRSPKVRSTWRDGGSTQMRDDMRDAVIRRFVVDPESGEVNKVRERMLREVVAELYDGIPAFDSMKATARKRWGLRMSDYREYTNGYAVAVLPRADA